MPESFISQAAVSSGFFSSDGTSSSSCFPFPVTWISFPLFSIRKELNNLSMISALVATVPKSARLVQCFAAFCIFAFHVADRIFHGGEQRCLRKISRRRCLSGCNCHFATGILSPFSRTAASVLSVPLPNRPLLPILHPFQDFHGGFFPALALHNLTFCRKTLSCQPAGKHGLIILKCRKQYCQESTYYQIIDLYALRSSSSADPQTARSE